MEEIYDSIITLFSNFMGFFDMVYNFLLMLVNDMVETIDGIVNLCVSGVSSISSLIGISAGGMSAINGVISYAPGSILVVIGCSVTIILLIAVIRLFVG